MKFRKCENYVYCDGYRGENYCELYNNKLCAETPCYEGNLYSFLANNHALQEAIEYILDKIEPKN